MTDQVLIIGAGMAGLSAGCYAQMNGLDSQIFELHFLPGGLCTSWKRKGYLFDGSIRYLTGTQPSFSTYQLWDELGLLNNRKIYYFDEFTRFEGRDGRVFILYTNIDRLEQHMLELSPQDAKLTQTFIEALRQFTNLNLPVDMTIGSPMEGLEMGQMMLPVLVPLLRWQKVTVREFASQFKDPLIREALPQFFQFSPPDFPMMVLLMTLGMMNDHEAGYPLGGSLAFAKSLADHYLSLGGKIHYNTRIQKILVEDNRAVGLLLEDGMEVRGDLIISAADGRATLFELLEGKYLSRAIRNTYQTMQAAHSILQISIGAAREFPVEPSSINFPLTDPIDLGGIPHDRLVMKHYNFDPACAPKGKSALTFWCEADYDYWKALQNNPQEYEAAKQAAAEQIIAALETRYPGIREQIEVIDVATPTTYERYTANWRGAIHGWALTNRKMSMMMGVGMSKTLPGLRNFYMIGQWVEPGGNVELSAASGRDVIKDICASRGKSFITRTDD